jgi:hypothetical protein
MKSWGMKLRRDGDFWGPWVVGMRWSCGGEFFGTRKSRRELGWNETRRRVVVESELDSRVF